MPIDVTRGSVIPKMPSKYFGIVRNSTPTTAATPRPKREATATPCRARSGLPAPRFWPAIVADAAIRPTEVQVMSEKSSV